MAELKQWINLHTHTYRCKHAKGDVEDYAKMALLKNVTTLGISDHTPLPDDWWFETRMGKEEFPGYMEEIERCRREYSKIRILAGLECDYSKDYESYFKDDILGGYDMDYLIGSVHAFSWKQETIYCFSEKPLEYGALGVYAEVYVRAMESGIFTFMAHPDVVFLRVPKWNEEAVACSVYLLQAAKDLKMPLEINCSGIRKSLSMGMDEIAYPKREFWELAGKLGVTSLVSSDAHRPEDLTSNLDAGYFIQREYGIKDAGLFAKP